jgi:hypothetical protein
VRKLRELFGDDGVIIEHNDQTTANVCWPPSLACWYNAQTAGEAMEKYWNNEDWLRYWASTYNISNINDILCYNTDRYFRLKGEKEHLDDVLLAKCLDNNIYQFYMGAWETQDYTRSYYENYFLPFWRKYLSLVSENVNMRKRVEKTCAQNNAIPRERWQSFLKGLSGKEALKPIEVLSFSQPTLKMLNEGLKGEKGKETRIDLGNGWSAYFGPNSDGFMKIEDGVLHIKANAYTCCYLEKQLPENVRAIECRVKAGPNAGYSYGIGIALRWCPEGGYISPQEGDKGFYPYFHLSLSQKGSLELIHMRAITAEIEGFPVGEWFTLRYRFLKNYCIAEVKLNDGTYRPLEIMIIPSLPKTVVIGKVETIGRNIDYGGDLSDQWVSDIVIY